MSVRNSRIRLVTAAASVALAAFSMTACGSSGNTKAAAGPSPAPAATTGGTAAPAATAGTAAIPAPAPAGTGTAVPTGKAPAAAPQPTGPKPATGTTAPKSPAAPAAPAAAADPSTCEGSNTRTAAALLNRPANHLLLTVTNTGSGVCYLYGYPAVRFDEAQSVPPVITDSKPQAVVTLKPGESGYASVKLSSAEAGSALNGITATSLTVYFHGRSGNESVGAGAHPSLPAKGVHVDDSLQVTYWQQSMDDAVSW
ncbi:DUF4232 domain-containing protein [Kitasatospora sp. NPDC056446]|uniref:DUF4232 domain-containing protein n=1 Tax=Kitasatospora sp. NPDC056446 TaxID=3345819 RepID=UPI0036BF8D44